MEWVIRGALARNRRPGYKKIGDRKTVDRDGVGPWLEEVQANGIRGILCLLEASELDLYDWLPGGLLEWYRAQGFQVEHVPIPDHACPIATDDQLRLARAAHERLPTPVLIHCSAGQGRTGAVIKFLQSSPDVRGGEGE